MELHLKIIGIAFMVLGAIHIVFPKRFDWKGDFRNVQLINKQMMYVHAFFVAVTVFLMGALCLTSASDLTNTPLGKKIAAGFFIFWVLRLLIQFFGYSPKLWKGKPFETTVHVLFSMFWVYICVVFFWVGWM